MTGAITTSTCEASEPSAAMARRFPSSAWTSGTPAGEMPVLACSLSVTKTSGRPKGSCTHASRSE